MPLHLSRTGRAAVCLSCSCVFLSLCVPHCMYVSQCSLRLPLTLWAFRSFETTVTWLSDIARHSSTEVVKILVALLHSPYKPALPLTQLAYCPSPSGWHPQLSLWRVLLALLVGFRLAISATCQTQQDRYLIHATQLFLSLALTHALALTGCCWHSPGVTGSVSD